MAETADFKAMSKALRVSLLVLAGLVVLPVIGLVVAVLITDDGIDSFRDDPVAHWVAQDAYSFAWVHHDNPIQRSLSPAARVVIVKHVGDHCAKPKGWSGYAPSNSGRPSFPAISREPESPYADVEREYVAQVRFYTFFGYPADDVYLTCGSASSIKPAKWY
jgi:hypothetical protein